MANRSPFAIADLWREWKEQGGALWHSFTQLTVNADEHLLMNHFHKPGSEKRSLVIVPRKDHDSWLICQVPEVAQSFMRLYSADKMGSEPAPK
jgi:putative SOS response-associated peptidase YedK